MFSSYASLALTPLSGFYLYRAGNKVKGWIALWRRCPHYLVVYSQLPSLRPLPARQDDSLCSAGTAWSLGKLAQNPQHAADQGWLIVFPIFIMRFLLILCAFHFTFYCHLVSVSACAIIPSPRYQLWDQTFI